MRFVDPTIMHVATEECGVVKVEARSVKRGDYVWSYGVGWGRVRRVLAGSDLVGFRLECGGLVRGVFPEQKVKCVRRFTTASAAQLEAVAS